MFGSGPALFLPAALAGGSGPSVIRTQSTNPAFGTNRTVGITAPASGNSLIVIAKAATNFITALTDNQGNTYTRDYLDAANSAWQIWRCHNVVNAPVTLMFTNSGDTIFVRVLEVSGLANAAPSVAGSNTRDNTSGVTTTRTHTTLTANELIVGGQYTENGAVTVSSVSPAGLVNVPAPGTSATLHGFYFVQPAAGAVSLSETISAAATARNLFSLSYAAA